MTSRLIRACQVSMAALVCGVRIDLAGRITAYRQDK